jgi:hypothetical protein
MSDDTAKKIDGVSDFYEAKIAEMVEAVAGDDVMLEAGLQVVMRFVGYAWLASLMSQKPPKVIMPFLVNPKLEEAISCMAQMEAFEHLGMSGEGALYMVLPENLTGGGDKMEKMGMIRALLDSAPPQIKEIIQRTMGSAHNCDKCNIRGHCPIERDVRKAKATDDDGEAVGITLDEVNDLYAKLKSEGKAKGKA